MTSVEDNVQQPTEALTEVELAVPSGEGGVAMKVTEKEEKQTDEVQQSTDPHAILMQMPVTDQNSALNCIIGFLGIAQRRGVYALDEAAKAYHCIQMFRPEQK
jgi:hypothetical protein